MTDKSKPWLAAKTAGEALRKADSKWVTDRTIGDDYREFTARAVIEWHEAQRVKKWESWETRFDWTTEKWVEIHVTRYRRKRA